MIALRPLQSTVPPAALWLRVAGGLSYMLGTVFYLWKRLPYHHAIWPRFVLGGSVYHFCSVFTAVIPRGGRYRLSHQIVPLSTLAKPTHAT